MSPSEKDSTLTPPKYDIDFSLSEYKGSYPKSSLVAAKKQIYDDFHVATSESLLELVIKRKCGILTQELLDYKFFNKRPCLEFNEDLNFLPARFNDSKSDNPCTSQDYIDQSDLNELRESNDRKNDNPTSSSIERANKNSPQQISKLERIRLIEPDQILSIDKVPDSNSKTSPAGDVYKSCLNLVHACKKRFCPHDLSVFDGEQVDQTRLVFVCDFCQHTVKLMDSITKHLQNSGHYSASKYLIDDRGEDIGMNFSYKIEQLVERASVRNLHMNRDLQVFCPECLLSFDTDTLACGIHYKMVHSSRNEHLYSISEWKRDEILTVDKRHTCVTCKSTFKKLTDLCNHLDSVGHFPYTLPEEINVYQCPFDNCHFTTIYYFPFKQHLLSHPFFNKPREKVESMFINIECSFRVYAKPISFFHSRSYIESSKRDRMAELKALTALMDHLKGHNNQSEIQKKLKARKDHLIKIDQKGFNKDLDSQMHISV